MLLGPIDQARELLPRLSRPARSNELPGAVKDCKMLLQMLFCFFAVDTTTQDLESLSDRDRLQLDGSLNKLGAATLALRNEAGMYSRPYRAETQSLHRRLGDLTSTAADTAAEWMPWSGPKVKDETIMDFVRATLELFVALEPLVQNRRRPFSPLGHYALISMIVLPRLERAFPVRASA